MQNEGEDSEVRRTAGNTAEVQRTGEMTARCGGGRGGQRV